MFAIFLLPRQFHTAIIENNKNTYQDSYLAFPFVSLLFNLLYFNRLGEYSFEGKGHNADTYSLLIPHI
jgi:hypothetical protein